MTGLVRKAALLSVGGLLIAASAMASVTPTAANSIVPCAINLVGNNNLGTAADPAGTFTVHVGSPAGPVSNAIVKVDFTLCCNDLRVSSSQMGAGVTVAGKVVSKTADVFGDAVFIIEGAASQGVGPTTGATGTLGCAKVSADDGAGGAFVNLTDGISWPQMSVAAFDLDGNAGAPGVGITDLSVWVSDKNAFAALAANYRQRSDYDRVLQIGCTAGVTVTDLAVWVSVKGPNLSIRQGTIALPATFAACP